MLKLLLNHVLRGVAVFEMSSKLFKYTWHRGKSLSMAEILLVLCWAADLME